MSFSRRAWYQLAVGACVIACALLVVKWQRDAAFDRRYRPRMAEKFGGAENLDIVSRTARIEVFRIGKLSDYRDAANASGTNLVLNKYPMLSGPAVVPPELQSRILNLLKSPTSYSWDAGRKACIIVPGMRLKLTAGKEDLDILFCFDCGIMVVFKDGIDVAGADFDPAERRFAAIFKALYPQDAEIQGL